MTLYGITPNGTVISHRGKGASGFGIVHKGKLVSFHDDAGVACDHVKAGQIIVGFGPTKLHSNSSKFVAYGKTTICYPECNVVRNCKDPALLAGRRWGAEGWTQVPACAKHKTITEIGA